MTAGGRQRLRLAAAREPARLGGVNSTALGFFDSGVGGLTVVRAVQQLMPAENILYLGDTARLPYGSKSPATIRQFADEDVRFLLAHGVKAVVVACNTASAHALQAHSTAISASRTAYAVKASGC